MRNGRTFVPASRIQIATSTKYLMYDYTLRTYNNVEFNINLPDSTGSLSSGRLISTRGAIDEEWHALQSRRDSLEGPPRCSPVRWSRICVSCEMEQVTVLR